MLFYYHHDAGHGDQKVEGFIDNYLGGFYRKVVQLDANENGEDCAVCLVMSPSVSHPVLTPKLIG